MGNYKDPGKGARIFTYVLVIILLVIFIGSVIRIAFGESSMSLSGFLTYIQDCPQIAIDGLRDFSISGNWGVVDGLRLFLNNIVSFFTFGVWFCGQLVNCLIYLLYFVRFIFLV